MGSGHAHAPVTATAQHRWRLTVAFGLITAFFVVELVAGVVSGSLALLSDAGHMAADVVTLGAVLVATRIATRPDATGRRTYGSFRAEVFASGIAVLVMVGVAVYIVVEALGRAGGGAGGGVASLPMLVVGGVGLLVNLGALLLLRPATAESLAVKGAHLEVLADSVGSAGVLVAGALVAASGNAVWDTVVALLIAVFVLVRAVALGREVVAVLGQHAPADLEPWQLIEALSALDGVASVHDLHVWRLTSGMDVATAHLVLAEGAASHAVLDAGRDTLRERFGIAHATLQVEPALHRGCDEVTW